MRGAITDSFAGDSVLITFSGHGSQLPNNSDDQETDSLDETLCFYDRMFVWTTSSMRCSLSSATECEFMQSSIAATAPPQRKLCSATRVYPRKS